MPKAKKKVGSTKKKNKYQLLVSAQARLCKLKKAGKSTGTASKTVTAKKKAYVEHAVKGGKSKTDANKIANKVTSTCKK